MWCTKRFCLCEVHPPTCNHYWQTILSWDSVTRINSQFFVVTILFSMYSLWCVYLSWLSLFLPFCLIPSIILLSNPPSPPRELFAVSSLLPPCFTSVYICLMMSSTLAVITSLLAAGVSSDCMPSVACCVVNVCACSVHSVLSVLVCMVLHCFCLGEACVVFVWWMLSPL